LVSEQIIYQTAADLSASSEAANESRHVETSHVNQKGHLTMRLKLHKVKVQVTSRGKVMIFWDSYWSQWSWRRIWRILFNEVLRTRDHRPLTTSDIVWLKRIRYPGAYHPETRLKALILDDLDDGSIESQLSVIDELTRTGRLRPRKVTRKRNYAADWEVFLSRWPPGFYNDWEGIENANSTASLHETPGRTVRDAKSASKQSS